MEFQNGNYSCWLTIIAFWIYVNIFFIYSLFRKDSFDCG
jgi:hypothetical protein